MRARRSHTHARNKSMRAGASPPPETYPTPCIPFTWHPSRHTLPPYTLQQSPYPFLPIGSCDVGAAGCAETLNDNNNDIIIIFIITVYSSRWLVRQNARRRSMTTIRIFIIIIIITTIITVYSSRWLVRRNARRRSIVTIVINSNNRDNHHLNSNNRDAQCRWNARDSRESDKIVQIANERK